jgi:hypothetical protein
MMMKLGLLSLICLNYSAEAFVSPQAPTAIRRGFASKKQPMPLHMLDPSHVLETASTLLSDATEAATTFVPEDGGIGYSKASYYTVLGLYALSFPGLWSIIKRSTKAKVKRKEFVTAGEKATPEGITLRQQAGEIMAYMKANNYDVIEAGETITFRGIVSRSLSQAFFLTFCTALGMLSLALVLQIQFHDLELPVIGEPNWYVLALLSPYAGVYYWKSGDRTDDCEVKLATNDEETENEIIVQGSDEEVERMWRTLGWQEKGMVYVPGLLEKS